MCGRFGFDERINEYAIARERKMLRDERIFQKEMEFIHKFWNRYDIRPTQKISVIIRNSSLDSPELAEMRWGWQPPWTKAPLINARSEKLTESHVWKKAFSERRCLVPASYFYEWQERPGLKKNVPWMIRKPGKQLFFFAGLYTRETDKKTGQEVFSATIITQPGCELMNEIHNHGGNRGRQPVILQEDFYEEYIDPQEKNPEKLRLLLQAYESGEIEAIPCVKIGDDKQHIPPVTDKSLFSPEIR